MECLLLFYFCSWMSQTNKLWKVFAIYFKSLWRYCDSLLILSSSGLDNLLNSQPCVMHFNLSDWFMESQLSSTGNDSWSSDIVRPNFEYVWPISNWLDMTSEHFTDTFSLFLLKLLVIHKIWQDTLSKGLKLRLILLPMQLTFHVWRPQILVWWTCKWQLHFSVLMINNGYFLRHNLSETHSIKKRSKSMLLLCCKGFSYIGKLPDG